MLVALFIMRPIPLPTTSPGLRSNGDQDYETISSGETIHFIPGLDIDSLDRQEQQSCTPLLGDRSRNGGARVGQSSSAAEMGHSHGASPPRADKLPNVYGIQLFMTPDFYIFLTIVSLCKSAKFSPEFRP